MLENLYKEIFNDRKLNRLKNYDYSMHGYYFITVCVDKRLECLGKIEKEEMILNEYGKIVKNCWNDLPNHYLNCKLDVSIVMPNHFHGIILIDNSVVGTGFKPVHNNVFKQERTGFKPVPTGVIKKYSLSEIIRGFKTFSSRRINEKSTSIFRWQRSFYDRIIRDEKSLEKIREYIINNPAKWEFDRNNPKNLKFVL